MLDVEAASAKERAKRALQRMIDAGHGATPAQPATTRDARARIEMLRLAAAVAVARQPVHELDQAIDSMLRCV